MSEGKLQTVDTTGKPGWCSAMVLAEVWDEEEKPEDCTMEYVAWSGGIKYPFRSSSGVCYAHASPIYAPEPKPRSLVWGWGENADGAWNCIIRLYSEVVGFTCCFIPARYENGELEPAPTVAEAKRRKEAGE